MLKATELRIGNYLQDTDGSVTKCIGISPKEPKVYVECENKNAIFYIPFDRIKPVPLTEEWLLKLGFVKEEDLGDMIYFNLRDKSCKSIGYGVCLNHDDIEFYKFRNGFKNPDTIETTNLIYDEPFLQYVHQLQNLMYALTGEELI